MMQLHCVLYRVYGVAEIAVALSSTRVNDDSTVSGDEPGLLQFQHVLAHGVVACADGLSDGLVAGRAPIGLPVLPVEQEGVDGNSGAPKVQVEDVIRQREKLFVGADRNHVRCDMALLHQLFQNGTDQTAFQIQGIGQFLRCCFAGKTPVTPVVEIGQHREGRISEMVCPDPVGKRSR